MGVVEFIEELKGSLECGIGCSYKTQGRNPNLNHLLGLNQLVNKNYHELFPGVLRKAYRNAESVYIEDDLFVLLRPAIKNGYEPFESFDRFEISREYWNQIKSGLVLIREYLLNQKKTELTEYIQPYFMTQTESFLNSYLENRVLIGELINEMIYWIEKQLIENEFITFIGL
ncbi:hypothetical protein AB4Z50_28185 [Paenibacillus sp. 2TAB26]|uniref:hypothetical protein n=1 Tax=Paenibacillus sp. 2TAB26 TaxID=3233005 RepID=UPI003F95855F